MSATTTTTTNSVTPKTVIQLTKSDDNVANTISNLNLEDKNNNLLKPELNRTRSGSSKNESMHIIHLEKHYAAHK